MVMAYHVSLPVWNYEMKISVLCTSRSHPVYPKLEQWCRDKSGLHDTELAESRDALRGGDILFLISCDELIRQDVRSKYRVTLVIHASDLPKGRGWSPHIWQVLEGRGRITVTLLEAGDSVDTGLIWAKDEFDLAGHELYDEINEKLFTIELKLMDYVVDYISAIKPYHQNGTPSYYRKRKPEDSMLDPSKTIAEQFNLLRVTDPDRYPAFFYYMGYRYKIVLSKQGKAEAEEQ